MRFCWLLKSGPSFRTAVEGEMPHAESAEERKGDSR